MIVKSKGVLYNIPKVDISPFVSKRIGEVDFEKILRKLLEDRKIQIVDLNTLQLEKGLRADDKDLGVYKRFSYKQRYRPVDLKDTGDFHRSIQARINPHSIEMTASDIKTDKLQDKYGDEILGLSDEAKQFIIDDIRNEFIEMVRKTILK